MWKVVLHITPTSTVIAALAIFLVCLFLNMLRERSQEFVTTASSVFLAFWGILVLAVTIVPIEPLGSGDGRVYWIPGEGLAFGLSGMDQSELLMIFKQEVANALMFAPLLICAFHALRIPSLHISTYSCIVFSVFIETVQWLERAGRTADADDVLFNTLGTLFAGSCVMIASNVTSRLRVG
jgi:VanZ family protein